MRHGRRLRVLTLLVEREARVLAARLEALAGERSPRRFRSLDERETEAMLGGELMAALSGVRRHA